MVWKLLWDTTQATPSILLPLKEEVTSASEACAEMVFIHWREPRITEDLEIGGKKDLNQEQRNLEY